MIHSVLKFLFVKKCKIKILTSLFSGLSNFFSCSFHNSLKSIDNFGGISNNSVPFLIIKETSPDKFCELKCNASGDSFLGQSKCGVNKVASVSQFILLLFSFAAVSFKSFIMYFKTIRFDEGNKSNNNCREVRSLVSLALLLDVYNSEKKIY